MDKISTENKDENTSKPEVITTVQMIANNKFDTTDGSALIDCNTEIIDSNTDTKLDTNSNKSNDKCVIYNLTDKTVINLKNQGTNSNPEYIIPCTGFTNNLSSKYILDTSNIKCTVKKAILSLVDNDVFKFNIDPNINCKAKFTGFNKTNINDNSSQSVCIQNCKYGAPFFTTIDRNRPVCKYHPIHNIVDNQSDIYCPDGKYYSDVTRLGISIDDTDTSGLCIANTVSYMYIS